MKVIASMQTIELTERNLRAPLAKLGGHPPDSACTISKDGWLVVAVPDEAHYSDRPPGAVHGETVLNMGRVA